MTVEERLARLEERIAHVIKKIDEIKDNHLPTIYKKLDRPSWIVTIVVTFLSSLSVGLIVRAMMI